MEPIPETRALLDLLWTGDEDLESWLLTRAQRVSSAIPGCVGISVGMRDPLHGTFTFVVTDTRLRLVDGAQYLLGGPCEAAIDGQEVVEVDQLSESRWQLAALAGAAVGVSSSLSFPLRSAEAEAIGSVNLYGSARDTFDGSAREVARLFGSAADEAVSNADLSVTGVDRARQSTLSVQEWAQVDIAVGVLAEREGVTVERARGLLEDAATRAGVPVTALAEVLLDHHSGGSTV